MKCEEYEKALKDPDHPCRTVVETGPKQGTCHLICEPFRVADLEHLDQVEVMFLGLNSGRPELKSKPKTPCRNSKNPKEITEYIQKELKQKYDKRYKEMMEKLKIGSSRELKYVKANVVHGIAGDMDYGHKCLEICGRKFPLLTMVNVFPRLNFVVYMISATRES